MAAPFLIGLYSYGRRSFCRAIHQPKKFEVFFIAARLNLRSPGSSWFDIFWLAAPHATSISWIWAGRMSGWTA